MNAKVVLFDKNIFILFYFNLNKNFGYDSDSFNIFMLMFLKKMITSSSERGRFRRKIYCKSGTTSCESRIPAGVVPTNGVACPIIGCESM